MTEKEKAKAYDKAIERAKKLYGNKITEEIFPELKESEDEKIRKEIISILRNAYWTSNRNRFNKLVAWLEKQRKPKSYWKPTEEQYEALDYAYNSCPDTERGNYYEGVLETLIEDLHMLEKQGKKSTDKIEPRFQVGDWVIFTTSGSLYQVEKKENYEYTLKNIHGGSFCVSFSNEELIREWTIEDAKDGDVLYCKSGWMCIFKAINNHTNTFSSYCFMSSDKYFSSSGSESHIFDKNFIKAYNGEIYHPATKEQRDTFMKAMNDTGYGWDAEKKELKKLVKPKFKVEDKIVNGFMKYMGAPGTQGTILKITDDEYIFTDGSRMSISSQDSWELVSDKKPKFDPKTLQPFDRVLARDYETCKWKVDFYSHKEEGNRFPYICMGNNLYKQCIPYNDDTKHLVGTTEDAPEYYRYWKE